MIFVSFFVLFVVAASRNIQFDPELNEHWENFKKTFDKDYDASEEMIRRSVWEQNVADITQHNLRYDLGIHSYRVGINEYSDMEHEEFVKMFNGFHGKPDLEANASFWVPLDDDELPDHVDWRTLGYVTPVENQGACGSCWAFSAVGAVEAQLKRKTDKLVPLSAQNLLDCTKTNYGCGGGYMFRAFEAILNEKGIDTAASYPYTGEAGDCRFNLSSSATSISDYFTIPYGDERILKDVVARVGPVSVSFDGQQSSFRDYQDGVYDDDNCGGYNHAGLVVGYGTEDGKDYWLVKNSWGTSWGMKGYVKMSRNNRNQCHIASLANFVYID